MANEANKFVIRASASRLDKGLLAVPQKFGNWFPDQRGPIHVLFDDEDKASIVTFHPFDRTVKENRILGLRRWYLKRGVQPGDVISVTLEDRNQHVYRIALERHVRERQQIQLRQKLQFALTDSEAERQLNVLSQLSRKRTREVAREELLRLAHESARRPRPLVIPAVAERREVVPPGTRVLLRELYSGKCQLCSFTFEKRNGEPYFEIHHLDPAIGHHPTNLLVVCPNCHAQLEHAAVGDFRWVDGWLVSLEINGKQVSVRQPLASESARRLLFTLFIIAAGARFARHLVR